MAPLLAALLLALAGAAGAEVIPLGDPPPHRVKAVPQEGFTLNKERLEAYGYTPESYQALPPPERDRVLSWIKVLEWERELEARRWSLRLSGALLPPLTLAPGVPVAVAPSSAAAAWTPDQRASIGRIKADTMFDGARPKASDPPGPPLFVPELVLFGPTPMQDGTVPAGHGIRRFSLVFPDDLRLEAGHLALDGKSPLLQPSPYFNVRKRWGNYADTFDWSVSAQAGAVDLGARLYHDRLPVDDRIDAGLDSLQTVDPTLGITRERALWLKDQFSFSTDFERQWIFVGSLIGRIGGAYTVYEKDDLGVDLGWSAMGLARVTHFFPNMVLDQTGALRLRSGGQNIGFFMGLSEGLGLFGRTVVSDSLKAEKLKTDVHPEVAPHATLAAWGKMPYLSSVNYSVSAGQQWNPWTTVTQVAGGLSTEVKGTGVGVYGKHWDENGSAMEYHRRESAAGLTVSPLPGLGLFGQYSYGKAAFGTATVDNHAVLFGLNFQEQVPGAGGGKASVTMQSLFWGKDRLVSAKSGARIAEDLQDALNLIRRMKDTALGYAGGPQQAWQDIQRAWARLDPTAKALLEAAWRAANPRGPSLNDIVSTPPSDWATYNRLANLLSDTEVLERLIVRYVRHQLLKELEAVEIPLLNEIRMSAPMVIAAAHAYSLSLNPPPPITEKDGREGLDAMILNQVSKRFGCDKGEQPQATTDCILATIPASQRDRIKRLYGDDINSILKTAVSWPSDVIRREMNALMLQIILAAERLNEMTADGGEKIKDLQVRELMSSFEHLDKRARGDDKRVYRLARERAEVDLAAVDARMRRTLAEYGAARLKWLSSQPSWPAGIEVAVNAPDWAGLLAVYGDKALFDLILRCKGALAKKPEGALAYKTQSRRVLIRLDGPSPMNSITTVLGDPIVIKLPRKGADLSLYSPSF